MRPAGEIRQALMKAVHELATDDRGATLVEIAERACVGRDAARTHIPKLKSRGHLRIVRERRVAYRNRPVAEYAIAHAGQLPGSMVLANCLQSWIG